jgi:glucose-1-phosphate thymidylyltransferase
LEAAQFIRVLQSCQGQLIAAPVEIAYLNGWIGWEELNTLAKPPQLAMGSIADNAAHC